MQVVVALLLACALVASTAWTPALPPSVVAMRARATSTVSPGGYPKEARDPLGHTAILPAPPQRVVSLTLSADEVLLELVAARRIAGLTVWVDDATSSLAGSRAPKSAARVTGEAESLIALDPDLVIASAYTRPEALTLLESAGVPVVGMGRQSTFAEVFAGITMLGDALGEPARAKGIVDDARRRIDAVASRPRTRRKRVLIWDGSFTYGAGTLEDEIVRFAGGENVAASLSGAAAITDEAVVSFAPEVIVVPINAAGVERRAPALVGDSPIWSAVGAVGRSEVYGIPRAWIGSVSHHAVNAVEALGAILGEGGA